MPYFVYKISAGPTELIKNLEKITEFDTYKEAKIKARELRGELTDVSEQIKVMFADNALQAEELLMEKRDQPVLREWEK